ncbi:hypothetical protein H4582DRAFT_1271234 [Lactarius indigo]|nr:hypothetical protein H4582DRAFT_1271234 [Lactarius indigo]
MGRSPALLPDEEFQLEGHIPDQPNAVLNTMNPGPVSWAAAVAGRQMLTGVLNPSDETCLTDETSSLRNSTPGDASMHRSTQDLNLGIDPNVKIEPEVEDVHSLFFFFLPRSFSLLTYRPLFILYPRLCPRVYSVRNCNRLWALPYQLQTPCLIPCHLASLPLPHPGTGISFPCWKSLLHACATRSTGRPPPRYGLGQRKWRAPECVQ